MRRLASIFVRRPRDRPRPAGRRTRSIQEQNCPTPTTGQRLRVLLAPGRLGAVHSGPFRCCSPRSDHAALMTAPPPSISRRANRRRRVRIPNCTPASSAWSCATSAFGRRSPHTACWRARHQNRRSIAALFGVHVVVRPAGRWLIRFGRPALASLRRRFPSRCGRESGQGLAWVLTTIPLRKSAAIHPIASRFRWPPFGCAPLGDSAITPRAQ